MNLAVLLLTVFWGLPPPEAHPGPPPRGRPTLERVCSEWRAGRMATDAQFEAALVALGRDALPELCGLLDAAPGDLPLPSIARTLGALGHPRCLDAIARFCVSPVAENRVAGLQALGQLGTDATLPLLAKALDDAEPSVAAAAEDALLSTKALPLHVVDALSFRFSRASDKSRVALLLARLGTEEGHAALIKHIDAIDQLESLAALQGLWDAARAEDGATLTELLGRSVFTDVRKQTCLLLGRLQHEPSIRGLIDCLRDPDGGLRANAHWALGQITGLPLELDPDLWDEWWRRAGRLRGQGPK